jgi:hypothetical protein
MWLIVVEELSGWENTALDLCDYENLIVSLRPRPDNEWEKRVPTTIFLFALTKKAFDDRACVEMSPSFLYFLFIQQISTQGALCGQAVCSEAGLWFHHSPLIWSNREMGGE